MLKDADLDYAVDTVMNAAFASTGRKCTATGGAIIEAPIYDAFVAQLVKKNSRAENPGPGTEAGVYMGPCADGACSSKPSSATSKKVKSKAAIFSQAAIDSTEGALAKGYFVEPTHLR